MPDRVEHRLAALPTMSKAALCDLWKQFFSSTPPTRLRRDLMIPILAYRMQEEVFGSLSARTRERLHQLSRAFEKGFDPSAVCAPRIRPGTRLVRQWGDRVHLVNVETNGYEYQGTRYQSLSEITRLITGTRGSGPLFFGIKTCNQEHGERRNWPHASASAGSRKTSHREASRFPENRR
jgi:Protein of unknown function (DUF2924)